MGYNLVKIKVSCIVCRKLLTTNNLEKHQLKHLSKKQVIKVTGQELINRRKCPIPATPCEYCAKIYVSRSGLNNHQGRCPKNPNRKLQIVTAAGKIRSAEARKERQEQGRNWWQQPELIEKFSATMKRAVKNNPDSYTSSNRGRTKQIIVDGIKLQGGWEVIFYNYATAQGLNPERPIESFPYEWNGTRRYFPDFYIPSLDIYVEVKGFETDRDHEKWSQFPKKLCIIKKDEIAQIKAGKIINLI